MLLFSEYNRSLKNISISQPIVDVDIEDTNNIIIRYPKFRRVTHLILSYDAQNLFTKEKSGYGYFMDLIHIKKVRFIYMNQILIKMTGFMLKNVWKEILYQL